MPGIIDFISRKRQIFTISLFLLAVVAAGCGECDLGQSRCQGNVLGRCMTTGDTLDRPHWVGVGPCPIACREAGGAAECVDSPDPLPECDGATATQTVCFEDSPANCWGDYPIRVKPGCPAGTHCLMTASSCGAVCVLEDTPDPRCTGSHSFCDENGVMTSCWCDFVAARTDCGPDRCHELAGSLWCTVSPAPDPRCGPPAPLNTGFCTGNVLNACWSGYVVEVKDCLGAVCTQYPSGPPACAAVP